MISLAAARLSSPLSTRSFSFRGATSTCRTVPIIDLNGCAPSTSRYHHLQILGPRCGHQNWHTALLRKYRCITSTGSSLYHRWYRRARVSLRENVGQLERMGRAKSEVKGRVDGEVGWKLRGKKRDAGGWQGTNTKIWGSKDGSGSKDFDWIGLDF